MFPEELSQSEIGTAVVNTIVSEKKNHKFEYSLKSGPLL
jgi:hypothetical protein